MIRHSSSLFISLVFHILLAFTIFLAYKAIFLFEKKEKRENRVKVILCHVQTQEKKIIKKIIKPKPIVKKIPIKKTIPKAIVKVKKIPQKIIPAPQVIKEVIKEIEPEIVPIPEVLKEYIAIETQEEKDKRLEKQYIENNVQKISELLSDNLYYPRSARKRGITGIVVVKFKLSTSATVDEIIVLSSNSEVLSRAAIKTIENLSGEFPKPREELILNVPIEYKLRR